MFPFLDRLPKIIRGFSEYGLHCIANIFVLIFNLFGFLSSFIRKCYQGFTGVSAVHFVDYQSLLLHFLDNLANRNVAVSDLMGNGSNGQIRALRQNEKNGKPSWLK